MMGSISLLSQFFPVQIPAVPNQTYLLGLRGWFVLQCFVWVFLECFVPVAVKGSDNSDGPTYQVILRKTLSVLFWNDNVIYSFFVLLSARSICIEFFANPTKTSVASSVFRRGLRLWFPTAVALALAMTVSRTSSWQYVDEFKDHTQNWTIARPYYIPTALAYFNSVFDLFWATRDFAKQAGNYAYPGQTMWIVNLLYSQSFTVYMTMIIIPYTRAAWRVKAFILFIIAAWWVQSWAWYTITGLLIADAVMHMNFKTKAHRGIPIPFPSLHIRPYRSIRVPVWIPYALLLGSGYLMQYLWTAWRPEWVNAELIAHTGLYYTGGLNHQYDLSQPQARDDAYLILLGLFLCVETYDILQFILSNRVLVYLGQRSFSWFLTQGLIIYTAGIHLFMHLNVQRGWPTQITVVTCFVTCLAATVVAAELFQRLIDHPSRVLARLCFDLITS